MLIGVSNYTAGWPKLESVPYEIEQVAAALKDHGFHVVTVMDPASDALNEAFEDFIDQYGFDEDNRLLFFFSGHGHTRKRGKKGYLVPTDAPDPRYDEKGFVRKAVGMNRILTWSREIEAKHAIFLFDSCFSGTVFKAKALPKIPPHISDVTSRPVRQFISAGSAGEEVPANSVFTPSFIRAVRGQGDLDRDGYLTGTELGMYLHKKVLSYNTGQHPQYGKIKDPDLDEGDFVFALEIEPPGPTPVIPGSGGIRDYDKIIEERNANRKKWDLWQKSMEAALAKVERYDKSSALNAKEKAEAWGGMLASYGADNPYSVKDDQFRKKAGERNRYWKGYKESGKLFVDTIPSNATIKILNIGPKFYQGMQLKPGRYHVETSKQGYETQKQWVKLEAGVDKKIEVRLEQFQTSSNVIKPDGIYIAYANGIVRDTNTGLEWKAGPDRETNWDEARSWVQSLDLDGGGWRMPSTDELRSLYKKGSGDRNITPLLKTSGWWVWSNETKDSSLARGFYFTGGYKPWMARESSSLKRAFAVRSRGDG